MTDSVQPPGTRAGLPAQPAVESLRNSESQAPADSEEPELIELEAWPSLEAPYILGAPRRIEDTRATLAYCLVGLLAAVMAGLLILLALGEVPSTNFAEVAGVLVSPLVGLVGAVAGYYYGKSDKS